MRCESVIPAYRVVAPGRRRSAIIGLIVSSMGAVFALFSPTAHPLAGTAGFVLFLSACALCAGISTLWSPWGDAMVGTILPIVYGERARGRWPAATGLYVLGLVTGAAILGGSLGALGSVVRTGALTASRPAIVIALFACLHLGYSGRELGLWRVPAPQSRWQVPRKWQRWMSARTAALLYGLVLGTGVAVRIPTSVFHVVLLWVFISGSPLVGAIALGVYGIGRGIPVIALHVTTSEFEQAANWLDRLTIWMPVMRLVNGVVLGGSGGWLLGLELFRDLS